MRVSSVLVSVAFVLPLPITAAAEPESTSSASTESPTPAAVSVTNVPDADRVWMNAAPASREKEMQFALRLAANTPGEDVFGTQVFLLGEVGFKQSKSVFLGAYIGGGIGGVGRDLKDQCVLFPAGCSGSTTSFRIGAEFQKHLLPGERFNPWLGIGLGYALSKASIDHQKPNRSPATAVAGDAEIRLMWGVDMRINPTIGLGPFIDGNYGGGTGEFRDVDGQKRDMKSIVWTTIGWRVVFFP